MVQYDCETCGMIFNMLSNFTDHINRPGACEKNLNKIHKCDYCDRKFTSIKGKQNHIKLVCNIKNPTKVKQDNITQPKIKQSVNMNTNAILNKEAIYLIYPKEFIDSEQNIYKIGMTTRMVDNRLAEYEKDSSVLLTRNVNDARSIEKILLNEFNKKFRLAKGREYFEGNYLEMIDIINEKIKESLIN